MSRSTGRPFPKGVSGNPGGRPKGLERRVREQFGGDVPKILEVFRDLALGLVPAGYERAEIKTSDRVKAGTEVIDRVLGRASQHISVEPEIDQRAIDLTKLTVDQLEAIAAIEFVEPVPLEPESDVEH